MSLKNLDAQIKTEYRSLTDNIVTKFYIPLLNEAKIYRRAVGFFSSTALVEISKGICKMAERGGYIQIVASPYLSAEDIEAIRKGYDDREKIIERALIRTLPDKINDYYSMQRLNLLAALIADNSLDIRIAYTENQSGVGMYHEKMGLIEDFENNIVAFSGSMNESQTAMSINYETIDVFCSWQSTSDSKRVQLKNEAFHSIWNNNEQNITVKEFKNVSELFISKYKHNQPNFVIDAEQFQLQPKPTEKMISSPKIPPDVKLYDYQLEAIKNWIAENYRGVFDMATGTGKTYTGLAAISKLSEHLNDYLAVIIVCPYQHLVDQWVDDIKKFNINPIIGYSTSPQKDWQHKLSKAVFDQKIRSDKKFFCFICTNATFANYDVQKQIDKIKSDILLVIDEAHNFGARTYKHLLNDRFQYRLALSATLDRHRDEEGTGFLYKFFGRKCIYYSLEQAIQDKKLTPYKYYPVLVYLNDDELFEYEQFSYEMSRHVVTDKNGNLKLTEYGEILAMQRSRIIAGAQEKLTALKKVIQPYIHEHNILVYCGSANVENDDKDDIRQIEAVTQILGNEFNMSVAKFTSQENIETRNIIKEKFQKNDGLQAIIAIKCLDEGVNIPGIKTAFILASTTNPKEYIQRRGRVLRRATGKEFAEIYDFVTLPRQLNSVSSLTYEQIQRDKSLIMNEISRMNEFGRLALNSMVANELIWKIQSTYNFEKESDNEYIYR